ncbi:MAG: DUF4157 domain-containing protein [Leptolyngbya sp. SIO4C5]|nr:DUF4157 domain-containing protein [Leptolyngbya sp. SIO4C5]
MQTRIPTPTKKSAHLPTPATDTGMFQRRPFPKPKEEDEDDAPDLQPRTAIPAVQLMDIPLYREAPAAEPDLQREAIDEEKEDNTLTAPVQTKLTMGQPGDKYEQEADQMAAKVMRMPESRVRVGEGKSGGVEQAVQRLPQEKEDELQQKPLVQRETMPEEDDEETLQPKPQLQAKGTAPEAPANFDSQLAQHKGSGQPLSNETRAFMEPRFGTDFSTVRVHETPDLANAIQAQAFTHGQDIYFNSGKYNPEASGGKELLAHELTHVVQQVGSKNPPNLQAYENSSFKQNDSNRLKTIASTEKLLRLFTTSRKTFWLGKSGASDNFTKEWIIKNSEDIKQVIRGRFKAYGREQIKDYESYIKDMKNGEIQHIDSNRVLWLEKLIGYFKAKLIRDRSSELGDTYGCLRHLSFLIDAGRLVAPDTTKEEVEDWSGATVSDLVSILSKEDKVGESKEFDYERKSRSPLFTRNAKGEKEKTDPKTWKELDLEGDPKGWIMSRVKADYPGFFTVAFRNTHSGFILVTLNQKIFWIDQIYPGGISPKNFNYFLSRHLDRYIRENAKSFAWYGSTEITEIQF